MSQPMSGHLGPPVPCRPGHGPRDRGSPKGSGGEKPQAALPVKERAKPTPGFCFPSSFLRNGCFLPAPTPPSLPPISLPSSLLPPGFPPFPQILESPSCAGMSSVVSSLSPSLQTATWGRLRGQQRSRSGRHTLPRSCVHTGPVPSACQSRAPGTQSGPPGP